jgi:large subunit ribosomal protein L24
MKKIHIKKGDFVKIIAGENKGQKGKVLRVNREDYSAIVEGVNIIHKHTKPNAKYTQGGIIEKEAPIHISNIQIVDSKGNATKIGRKVDENKRIIRYSKKSGEELK